MGGNGGADKLLPEGKSGSWPASSCPSPRSSIISQNHTSFSRRVPNVWCVSCMPGKLLSRPSSALRLDLTLTSTWRFDPIHRLTRPSRINNA
ncbi:hypothetical protein PoB_003571800 [Plakobranchus ocellatus]|uniref:Uncharacterized protein n=1 Tax=Plakobranchus ocellatus TaxID=259542 RepID=A0AAV4AQW4_9GAST|nr:hypothetical protein PoB_003571800 [Plakobranchus ocellatus]